MWNWDEDKRQINLAKHGVDFAAVAEFDWVTAVRWADTRFDYGENREVALALIGARIYYLAFTSRDGKIRIISLRKANMREQAIWNMHAK